MRTIPKAENTSKHKDNQQYGQSNAIKTVQSTIRPEQCNQSNQSNMNPRVVTLLVALMQKPETQAKPDDQEVDIER